jgi:alpha-glucoside transport system substrate-binding protein
MSLRIQFLGQPRLLSEGRRVNLPGNRPLALLAYLLLTRKAHPREHLIDLFFDGPADPRAALRWALSKIRKAIGDEYILAEQDEIAFNFASDYWLDVKDFEAGEMELYQGDLLEGLYLRDALRFEEWLLFERQRLRGQYQGGLEKQLAVSRQQGDTAAVVIMAQRLLALDNLREDWHRSLMEAFARQGKRATALDQFEQCRQALRAEWDMEPSQETVALAEAIRRGELAPELSPLEDGAERIGMAPQKPALESTGGPTGRRRVGSRSLMALIGGLSVLMVVVLVLSRVVRTNSQAYLTAGSQPALNGAAGQPETNPGALAGKTVWVLQGFHDEQSKLFQQSMTPLEERTGLNVEILVGSDTYDLELDKLLEADDLPDIIAFPQPGWLATLAEQGKIVNLNTFLEDNYLRQQYSEALLELTRVDGQVMGIWYNIDIKSLVWYPKEAFKTKGYQAPETWDELIALSDRIVADGGVPWCIGIESGDATGWVGTDWVEDILLRTAPPETYDAWVNHELPFDSTEIRRVFEIMGQIWLNDAHMYGGTARISSESFADSPDHLFENPPGCYLHRQASFAPFFFPPGVHYGQDYDFFYLPPIDPEYGRPVLGSGNIVVMVNDRPEVREVMRYLTTAESVKAQVQNGGFLSPHRDTPLEWFPNPEDLRFFQIMLSADTYRFDGSDLMPEQVGLGSFFRGITEWVEGADLGTVLQKIDKSWPE